MLYSFKEIEQKIKKQYVDGPFEKKNGQRKEKYYCLDMFPYPSGSGLHVGHWRGYVLSDIYARIKWLEGYELLHPMGWDAFGLPAENYAIQNKMSPEISTEQNIKAIKNQIKQIWAMYDWSKEINTTDPHYYHWTQWIFVKMYEAGLAYQAESDINWCPSCKTGLANEEVVGGKCDRCGTESTKKKMKQWMLKITEYAEELLNDLDTLDWPEKVKTMQRNWIGKSIGLEIIFNVHESKEKLIAFTTRPETIYGITFMAIGANHPLLKDIFSSYEYGHVINEQNKLIAESKADEIWGVFTGKHAVHPLTKQLIPIYIASYVLKEYGTGVVMGVPAHDERDYKFALKHSLNICSVIQNPSGDNQAPFVEEGVLMGCDAFDGMASNTVGRNAISDNLVKRSIATKKVTYKMRDWVFSRQRYWGEPIPIIHCPHCGILSVPEKDLPVLLPKVESYEPTGTGESPLAAIDWWVNTTCHRCHGPAKRETNTMPQWAGSSWYFLRYVSPDCPTAFADPAALDKWMPVDLYVGGVEHAILHLLYARFYVKFLYEYGYLKFNEPFVSLFNQGMITKYSEKTKSCEKMSKSKGNVVSPDDLIEKYGTDALRLYIIFLGPPELDCQWQDAGIDGCARFLNRLWEIMTNRKYHTDKEEALIVKKTVNKFIKKFMERINNMSPNTAVAAAMELVNAIMKESLQLSLESQRKILTILSIMTPFIATELLSRVCNSDLKDVSWPQHDEEYCYDDLVTIVIQVNGKMRGTIQVDVNVSKEEIQRLAQNEITKWIDNKIINSVIYVPSKLINFIITE